MNGIRGREIHLPDNPPTSGVDNSYFGQSADYSSQASGLYYRSALNLPWAINVTGSYTVPAEKALINKGYLKFVEWENLPGINFLTGTLICPDTEIIHI